MLEEEGDKKAELTLKKEQEFKLMQESLISAVEAEIKVSFYLFQQRKENELITMKTFEDKLAQLKEEIEKEIMSGRENLSYLKGFLENDIPKLHERLQIEMQEREEQDNMIALKTSEELAKLQEAVINTKQ